MIRTLARNTLSSAFTLALCGAFFLLGQIGCTNSSVDPALLAKYQEKFTLTSEPPEVDTVYGIRETLLGTSEADHEDHDHDHSDSSGHDHDSEDQADHEEEAHEHEEHNHTDEHAHEHAKEVAESTEPQHVAMVGQIGGLANPWEETQPEFPFAKSQAIFFLADPQAIAEHAAEGHVHAPGEECAFCAAHAEENSELLAVVRLVDEKGQVVPIDARELLNLKVNDMVVVEGEAQVLEGGMMVVKATGVFVRK
ncbi:AbrB/MazE/SpoVT family DNA-binding domain-containing protein [Bythopirellula goksoeyrii]|uniref:Uncharacterized protein n=1 Tax=Bythopirellula goksoeyrii TaxID=1400387 RepID=A0A5B9QAB8_9BACT|nr:AbrB/MazE/SpoVT family DNA-binding domain-containing protein [Bythopirellula goksoeyrii]QEG34689.1 hypothetical protein Pr1d_19710 [Bythopirellula goksoeyrii]